MKRVLLACGIVSSLLYLGADILGALRYGGYSYVDRTVSELTAIGAPTRALVVPLYLAYDVLLVAFGVGIWTSADRKRALRITAALLAGIGILGLAARFPMNVRGAERTLTDTMHIVITGVTVLVFLLSVAFGARAFGRRFCVYSVATFLTVLTFVALAGVQVPKIAANQPTPWIGIAERISIGAYLFWVAVLAVILLRGRAVSDEASRTSDPRLTQSSREAADPQSPAGDDELWRTRRHTPLPLDVFRPAWVERVGVRRIAARSRRA